MEDNDDFEFVDNDKSGFDELVDDEGLLNDDGLLDDDDDGLKQFLI